MVFILFVRISIHFFVSEIERSCQSKHLDGYTRWRWRTPQNLHLPPSEPILPKLCTLHVLQPFCNFYLVSLMWKSPKKYYNRFVRYFTCFKTNWHVLVSQKAIEIYTALACHLFHWIASLSDCFKQNDTFKHTASLCCSVCNTRHTNCLSCRKWVREKSWFCAWKLCKLFILMKSKSRFEWLWRAVFCWLHVNLFRDARLYKKEAISNPPNYIWFYTHNGKLQ